MLEGGEGTFCLHKWDAMLFILFKGVTVVCLIDRYAIMSVFLLTSVTFCVRVFLLFPNISKYFKLLRFLLNLSASKYSVSLDSTRFYRPTIFLFLLCSLKFCIQFYSHLQSTIISFEYHLKMAFDRLI